MKRKMYLIIPVGILAIAAFAAAGGEIVKLLWNWLAPMLFGFRQITFWQGLGLLALCRILFGGWGFHGHGRSKMRDRMHERWDRMSPEEREQMRQRWRAKWGFGPGANENQA